MTDKERLKTIKAILFILDHPAHVDNGDSTQVLINRTKNYDKITDKSTNVERFFAISGQDVYESGRQWSCGTLAKSFCWVNSKLKDILGQMPREHKKQLEREIGTIDDIKPFDEVRIMISVHPDHLIDAMDCHTLPCIKMDDGKWHAIEPNTKQTEPEHKDYPIIQDEIKVGGKIHHIFSGMDTPFEIRQFMSWAKYESDMSDFKKFLKTTSKRDKQTEFIIGQIETVLGQINKGKSTGRPYSFCRALDNDSLKIKILSLRSTDSCFTTVAVQIHGDLYHFNSGVSYACLHRLQRLGKDKLVDTSLDTKYTITAEYTPDEYIKHLEIENQTQKRHNNGKIL